jgi:hypothetical protein
VTSIRERLKLSQLRAVELLGGGPRTFQKHEAAGRANMDGEEEAPMLRPIAAGLAVFAAAYVLRLFIAPFWMWFDFIAPAVAGFAAAWLASRRRIIVGVATAVAPTVLYGVTQAVCEVRGRGCDQVGAAGAVFLTVFTLAWNLVVCGAGAVLAVVLRSRLAARAA